MKNKVKKFDFKKLEEEIRYPGVLLVELETAEDQLARLAMKHPGVATLKECEDNGIRWEKAVFKCYRTDSDEPTIITFDNAEQTITIEADKLSIKECSTAISMMERQDEIDTNNSSRDIANACMAYMEFAKYQKLINKIIISKVKGGYDINFIRCI